MTTTVPLTRPRRTRWGMRAIWGCSTRASTAGATRPAPSVSAIGPRPDQLAGREVDERGREHQGEAVGEQHEDEQVASGDLGHVGVGRDERRGWRGGDQEEAEAERIVEPDREPDERQGKRGEREVQAEQDQPGAQLDRRARAGAAPRP